MEDKRDACLIIHPSDTSHSHNCRHLCHLQPADESRRIRHGVRWRRIENSPCVVDLVWSICERRQRLDDGLPHGNRSTAHPASQELFEHPDIPRWRVDRLRATRVHGTEYGCSAGGHRIERASISKCHTAAWRKSWCLRLKLTIGLRCKGQATHGNRMGVSLCYYQSYYQSARC